LAVTVHRSALSAHTHTQQYVDF